MLTEEDEEYFIRLLPSVRQKYMEYLVKMLQNNWNTWFSSNNNKTTTTLNPLQQKQIRECANKIEYEILLECVMAPIYQKKLCKIISEIRLQTSEIRLMQVLEESLTTGYNVSLSESKATQTEYIEEESLEQEYKDLDLEQKISLFQKHLSDFESHDESNTIGNGDKVQTKSWNQTQSSLYEKEKKQCAVVTSTNDLTASSSSPGGGRSVASYRSPSPTAHDQYPQRKKPKLLSEEDEIAKELAEMFSEERTEFDEIFGFDPNNEPTDPETLRILEQIENAKTPEINKGSDCEIYHENHIQESQQSAEEQRLAAPSTLCNKLNQKLHSSLPCEIFMLKRKLSEKLNELVAFDMRLYDEIKLKFVELFGEDSDDEFGTYSPSTDLTEEILSSCIYRISRWMVKCLMQPLQENLIGNRFLFKKLAKKLSHRIILHNYYPDEHFIRKCVESFFCLIPEVKSIADINLIDHLVFNDEGDAFLMEH